MPFEVSKINTYFTKLSAFNLHIKMLPGTLSEKRFVNSEIIGLRSLGITTNLLLKSVYSAVLHILKAL